MKFGVDVSKYQRGLDLKSVKAENGEFVIIRAVGEGLYVDPQFDGFYKQAKALGMEIGAYLFGKAFSVEEAYREAAYFIRTLQDYDIKYVFYDVEARMLNQGYDHLTQIIRAFCDTMNASGYICGIYSSESPFNTRFNDKLLNGYPHWVAKYSKNSPVLKSGNTVDIWQFGGETNYLRSNKIAGYTIDQNYSYMSLSSEEKVSDMDISKLSIEDLAHKVIEGAFGTGALRKAILGDRFAEVQTEVNKMLNQVVNEKPVKTVDQLAIEVLAGEWGVSPLRAIKLTAAGYDAKAVQARVNQIAAERKATKKTYIIVKGDTLSAIAKRYNTTVSALQKANNIKNANKISVGQSIIIA